MAEEKDFATYEEFWPTYLSQHARHETRMLHIAGTVLALMAIVKAIIYFSVFWLLMAPIIGYGIAWIAHTLVEKNHPATFTYPLWSLRLICRCLGYGSPGRLARACVKHNITMWKPAFVALTLCFYNCPKPLLACLPRSAR